MTKFLLLSLVLMFITSCQTKPVVPTGSFQKAKWDTIAQINDLKRNKNQRVSVDIVAVKNEKMRMEVSATLGYQVASILINREGFKAAIYPQKKFYQGAANEQALSQALNFPVSPRVLFAIAFDEPVQGNNWSCEKDQTGLPKKCEQSQLQIQVDWTRKSDGTKLVKIVSPRVELNWFFKNPEVNFIDKPEIFSLSAPAGYQVIGPN